MVGSSFSLRQIADGYCQFVVLHFKFLGLDVYQVALSIIFLAALCSLAFLASGSSRAAVNRVCPPWLYGLLLILTLFIIRLPAFLPGSMNPDESMFLAGAMKLRHDPVFWRSLDGNTSGPLNFFPLTLLNVLGLSFDYATARLLNVICIGAALAIVYYIARLFMEDGAARLTPLPALAAVMDFRDVDFLHYSSECISVLLIAVATWLVLTEDMASAANWLRGAAIGAIVALVPLAKLQAAPMAATIFLGAIASAFFKHRVDRWQRAMYVVAGLLAVMTSLFLFLLAFGLFETFQISYITSNLFYADISSPLTFDAFLRFCGFQDMEWYERGVLACLLYALLISYYLWMREKDNRKASTQVLQTAGVATLLYCVGAWWLSPTPTIPWPQLFIAVLIGFTAGAVRRALQQPSALGRLSFCDLFTFSILAASLYSIYRPARLFPHYLVFLIFPLALAGVRALASLLRAASNGAPSAATKKRGRVKSAAPSKPLAVRPKLAFVLLILALPCFMRSRQLTLGAGSEVWMAAQTGTPACAPCELISHFAKPGDAVSIWGWSSELHVLTGTIPATREPNTPWQLIPGPLREYYRSRFLKDLEQNPPKVFADAVGPGHFIYQDRNRDGYQTFPGLLGYISNNFYLAGDVGGVRVFVRKDIVDR